MCAPQTRPLSPLWMVNDFIVAVLYHSFLQTVLICVFDLFVHGVRARVHVNYKQKPQTDKIPNILHKIAHKKKHFIVVVIWATNVKKNLPTVLYYRELECVNNCNCVNISTQKRNTKENK